MIKKSTLDLSFFVAGDKTHLQEVIHPKNDNVNLPYSLAKAYLEVGAASLPHSLEQAELYYFLKGEGEIFVEDQKQVIKEGELYLD